MTDKAVYTHKNIREKNQDIAFLAYNTDNVIKVQSTGKSEMDSPETIGEYCVYSCLFDGMGGMPGDSETLVAQAARRFLYMYDEKSTLYEVIESLSRMFIKNVTGTTICRCGVTRDGVLEYNWLGDSRIYLYRKEENRLYSLTTDNNEAERCRLIDIKNHSGESVPFGKYADKQHLLCGFIGCNFGNFAEFILDTYSVCTHKTSVPDFDKAIACVMEEMKDANKTEAYNAVMRTVIDYQSAVEKVASGDVVVLCSDGAVTNLTNDMIFKIVSACAEDMESLCEVLCAISMKSGSTDNQTVSCFIVP